MPDSSKPPGDPVPSSQGAESYTRLITQAGGDLVDITSVQSASGLQVALYQSPGYDLQVPPIGLARLSINLRNAPVSGGLADDRPRDFSGRRYSMFLAPAGVDARWRKPAPSRHLNIYFSSVVMGQGEDADGRDRRLGDEPLIDLYRPELRTWIDALEQCMLARNPFAEEAGLGLARLIVASLAGRDQGRPGQLAPAAIAHLRDYIRAHLEGTVRVRDLASVARLTPHRFTLAFAAVTGRTPHRFVLECRLARAMELLRDSGLPLADVAAACGFASQQHLTSAMRRVLGTTPGQVRRSALPVVAPKPRR